MRLTLVAASLLTLAGLAWPVAAQHTPASVPTAPAVDEGLDFREEHASRLIGGIAGLQAAVVYPPAAREARTEGRVVVTFVVDERGTPTDLVVARSLTPETDAEALRVVGLARFVPFEQNGQPVTQRTTLPVIFRLDPRVTPARAVAGSVVIVALVTLVGAVVMFLTGGPWNRQ